MTGSYARQYSRLWHEHWWWRARHRLVLGVVREVLGRHRADQDAPAILDIGCGGGLAFDDFARFGHVHGLEPDPVLLESQPQWRDHVEQARFGSGYVAPRRYDLVVMLDVLEHIPDDAGAVDNLVKLLKPGGHVLLTVPARLELWSVHDEANRHFRRYHRGQLRRLLQRCGLELVKLRYFFVWSWGLLYLRRFLCGRQRPDNYQVTIPVFPINAICQLISRMEEWLLAHLAVEPPIGSSLLAIARRPPDDNDPAHDDLAGCVGPIGDEES